MGFTEPDSAPSAPGQMPQAMTSGPAPVPYGGQDESPEPPDYAVGLGADAGGVTSLVMADLPAGNAVQEAGYAHDTGAGLVNPYYAGGFDPVKVHGDDDPGGRSPASQTVAGAVGNTEARWHNLESDTYAQGGVIGDLIQFPPSGEDPGAGVGNTDPAGGFFDPPRGYGGEQGAPGYQGEAQ